MKRSVDDLSASTNERLSKVETFVENASAGVTIRNVECIPLNRRIIVEANKSYDFCDTSWTLQITRITETQAVIRSNGLRIPSTYDGSLVPKGCELQMLQSIKNDENYKVEIRGRCE